eukprot:4809907-Prymnesium_polylepis.1
MCVSDRHAIEGAPPGEATVAVVPRKDCWRGALGRTAGSPARATPTAEDASPGPPGRLVVRPCFVQ